MQSVELDYGAFSVDTCIFDEHGIALEKGLFKQLDQFRGGPVKFLLSDIVHREVLKHLIEKTKEARSKVAQALKAANSHLVFSDTEIEQAKVMLLGVGEEKDIAERRLSSFYSACGVELVQSSIHADVSELVRMYFDCVPPFEGARDKKNEFPDALALLSLEKWAEMNNTKVLVVSNDGGWKRYAETSGRIDVVGALGEAISHFQPHNAVRGLVAGLRDAIIAGAENTVLESVRNAIENSLDGIDIDIEANSSRYFETDDVYATYVNHEFVCDPRGEPEINLIRVEADCVVLQLAAEVTCEVHCSFDLSIWDSIDKEYIGMGSTDATKEETYQSEVVVSLTGDFGSGLDGVEVEGVEVAEAVASADFGNIEIDWGSDD